MYDPLLRLRWASAQEMRTDQLQRTTADAMVLRLPRPLRAAACESVRFVRREHVQSVAALAAWVSDASRDATRVGAPRASIPQWMDRREVATGAPTDALRSSHPGTDDASPPPHALRPGHPRSDDAPAAREPTHRGVLARRGGRWPPRAHAGGVDRRGRRARDVDAEPVGGAPAAAPRHVRAELLALRVQPLAALAGARRVDARHSAAEPRAHAHDHRGPPAPWAGPVLDARELDAAAAAHALRWTRCRLAVARAQRPERGRAPRAVGRGGGPPREDSAHDQPRGHRQVRGDGLLEDACDLPRIRERPGASATHAQVVGPRRAQQEDTHRG